MVLLNLVLNNNPMFYLSFIKIPSKVMNMWLFVFRENFFGDLLIVRRFLRLNGVMSDSLKAKGRSG